jgi:two-component system CheB/CheR fusion protein
LAEVQAALQSSRECETELRRELAHRVRNALAVTRSVLKRTMATATSVEEAGNHLSGRVDSLFRYQGRLAALPGAAFDLETMVRDELVIVASGNDPRIVIEGPPVLIDPPIAEVIGLALHELATNSVKFGVLGDPSGNGGLQISWRDVEGNIHFEWKERGVPIVASAPIKSGFGQEYIEQALPYQLGAATQFSLSPGGFLCSISFNPNKPPLMDPVRA